ncbi:MAG: type II secretion system F family protein [Patescibacteria group bacterium]
MEAEIKKKMVKPTSGDNKPARTKKPFKLWLMDFGLETEKENFINNLTMLLAAGMSILPALEAVKSEMRTQRMRLFIDSLILDVDGGLLLWQALDKTAFFSNEVTSLIKIGESSGRLVENLKVVNIQQQKERSFRSKVRSAMIYPVFVIFVTLVVGLGVSWFVLPRLAGAFGSIGTDLPWPTRILIWIGDFISLWGWLFIPVFLVVLLLSIYFVFIFPRTKFLGQYLFFYLPVIKRLVRQTELARFGYMLGTLLQAGLPLLDALDLLAQVTNFRVYQKFYQYLKDSVDEGNSFKKSFANYHHAERYIPKSTQQLIFAGEQSGSLPEALIQIGKNFEDKIEATTKDLSVILEPLLLFIVWFGVLLVAVAIILPIYGLFGSIQY